MLTTPAAERIFAIFFEAIGLAAAGTDPYDQLVPAMMQAWLDWLTTRSTGASASVRRRNALAVIARVDGLLLVRQTLGTDAANDAARALGITEDHRPGLIAIPGRAARSERGGPSPTQVVGSCDTNWFMSK